MFDLNGEFDLPQNSGDMLAALKWTGEADRTPLGVGLQCNLGGLFQGGAGRFLNLKDHFIEAVKVIIIKNDNPRGISLGFFIRDGFDSGEIENFRAHIRPSR